MGTEAQKTTHVPWAIRWLCLGICVSKQLYLFLLGLLHVCYPGQSQATTKAIWCVPQGYRLYIQAARLRINEVNNAMLVLFLIQASKSINPLTYWEPGPSYGILYRWILLRWIKLVLIQLLCSLNLMDVVPRTWWTRTDLLSKDFSPHCAGHIVPSGVLFGLTIGLLLRTTLKYPSEGIKEKFLLQSSRRCCSPDDPWSCPWLAEEHFAR